MDDVRGTISLAVSGASGRMGSRVLQMAGEAADIDIVAAWVGAQSARLGEVVQPGRSVRFAIPGDPDTPADVVVDFSHAGAFDAVLAWCVGEHVALVTGTTGLATEQFAALDEAARSIPVLWAANFSPGIAVLDRMVAEAARVLSGWDVEIVEAHHAGKRDAPSGTALALGREIAKARGQQFAELAVFDRHGSERPRAAGDIGFAVTRAGDIVGEHTVVMATTGERLELCHRATDRLVFARGALHAARWLVGREAGRYTFADSLG